MSGGDFYTTAAQVIPLVFVAIAFEGRAVWKPVLWEGFGISVYGMSMIRAFHLLITTAALVVGEVAALWALSHDAPLRFGGLYAGDIVVFGLMVGGLSLVTQVIAQVMLEMRAVRGPDEVPPEGSVHWGILALIVFGTAGILGCLAWSFWSALSN